MKMTAQGVKINSKTHILFSPQMGTKCGIYCNINKNDIIELSDSSEVTCEKCMVLLQEEWKILSSISSK